MYWRTLACLGVGVVCLCSMRGRVDAQHAGVFRGSADDPAIAYATAPLNNVVVDVNRKLQEGAAQLTFDGRSGFLRSALEALQIPVDSQLLVFSRLRALAKTTTHLSSDLRHNRSCRPRDGAMPMATSAPVK